MPRFRLPGASSTRSVAGGFRIVYSDTVSGFDPGDPMLAGKTGATTATVTGAGSTYTDAVSGLGIGAGVATDMVGNANLESTSPTNVVGFDAAAPSITAPTGAVVVASDLGANDAVVTFDVTAADVDCSAVAQQSARLIEDLAPSGVTRAPASGSLVATVSGVSELLERVVDGRQGISMSAKTMRTPPVARSNTVARKAPASGAVTAALAVS